MPRERIVVEEQIIEVSEIRIRNAIKEYKKGVPFTNATSASFGCSISFVTAYAAFSNTDSPWKWVFFASLIVSLLCLIIFGIISIARFKSLKGTEDWVLDEIKNTEHNEIKPIKTKNRLSRRGKKIIFNTLNFVTIFGVLILILLLTLGLNNWNLSDKEWAPAFLAFYIVFGLVYLLFGTYINALLASILFGYDEGFPGID